MMLESGTRTPLKELKLKIGRKTYEVYKADERLDIWLWLQVQRGWGGLSPDIICSPNTREILVSRIGDLHLNRLIDEQSPIRLLAGDYFKWIANDKRQLEWLSLYVRRELQYGIIPIPTKLFGREFVIASIDFLESDLNTKAGIVDRMRWGWNEHVKKDSTFKWFQGEEEESRCACAWDWLVEKRGQMTLGRDRIINHEDLLIFFDALPVDDAQKREDISAIKLRWRQRKFREKNTGKSQYNFLLSDKAIIELDKLVLKYGVKRLQILEALIQFEAEKGFYLPEKVKKITWN
jgi:hypothetical protein